MRAAALAGMTEEAVFNATFSAGHRAVTSGCKCVGRKRSIVVDTLGLLLLVTVTAASVSDNEAGMQLLDRVAAVHPTIRKAWIDTGYKKKAIEHGAALGIDVDIVPRNEQVKASP